MGVALSPYILCDLLFIVAYLKPGSSPASMILVFLLPQQLLPPFLFSMVTSVFLINRVFIGYFMLHDIIDIDSGSSLLIIHCRTLCAPRVKIALGVEQMFIECHVGLVSGLLELERMLSNRGRSTGLVPQAQHLENPDFSVLVLWDEP